MAWLQLMFQAPPDMAELVGQALEESGAEAVTLLDAGDDPIYEPEIGKSPLWGVTRVTGLFSAETDMKQVLSRLNTSISPKILPPYELQPLPDEDWERVWLKDFKPLQFGPRLWIVPSVFEAPDPTAVSLRLDPGLAFGTGTHPTTALCLRWLEAHIRGGERILDFGCGSGILAIAALMLGAKYAMATDIDPQALQATLENASQNNVLGAIDALSAKEFAHRIERSSRGDIGTQTDIVVANILANPLIELAPLLAKAVIPGGYIVLSGILDSQIAEVEAAYRSQFALAEPVLQEQWVLLTGKRIT